MKKKITVQICTGTNCYVFGGANLLDLEKNLPSEVKEKVEVKGATCLGFCKDKKYGKAPFVLVEDELVSEADVHKVIKKVMQYVDKVVD